MKTTAKVTTPNGTRYVPDSVNHNGYLAQESKRGIGDPRTVGGFFNGEGDSWDEYDKYETFLKPIFNGSLVNKSNKKSEIEKLMEKKDASIFTILGTEYEKFLLKWGENPEGYLVVDNDEERKKAEEERLKLIANKKLPVNVYIDAIGLRVSEKLPERTWALLKPYASYFKADESDMEFLDDQGYYNVSAEKVRGWYYGYKIIEILSQNGYIVSFEGITVTNENDLKVARQQITDAEHNYFNTVKELTKKIDYINQQVREAEKEYCTKEECKEISKTKITLVLDWQGANIYGGGKWLHQKGEDLYVVHNNGHDGDNWGENNYETGGAGAICHKIKGGAHFLAKMREISETYKDYLSEIKC